MTSREFQPNLFHNTSSLIKKYAPFRRHHNCTHFHDGVGSELVAAPPTASTAATMTVAAATAPDDAPEKAFQERLLRTTRGAVVARAVVLGRGNMVVGWEYDYTSGARDDDWPLGSNRCDGQFPTSASVDHLIPHGRCIRWADDMPWWTRVGRVWPRVSL